MIVWLLACSDPPREGPPNLVLVSVDGLRADYVGVYGARWPATPSIDAAAAEGVTWTWHFSQSNESLFSHASMFTGRHVSELGVPDYRTFTVPDEAMLVSEILGLYGYQTAAYVAGGHIRGEYGFDQGFSKYEDDSDFGALFHKVDAALDWSEAAQEPFFLVLHGYDLHRPYQHAGLLYHVFDGDYEGPIDDILDSRTATERIYRNRYFPDFEIRHFRHATGDLILDPEGYSALARYAEDNEGIKLSQEDLDHVRAHYASGALGADQALGVYLDGLKAAGLWDDTLVIITADHGEDLNDHGFYNHRTLLHDSTTRVPLILTGGAVPEALRGTVRDDLSQAIDVVPTLLAAAGATAPAELKGRNLLGKKTTAPSLVLQEGVLPMLSARTATHRLVFSGVPLASPWFSTLLRIAPVESPYIELYDLEADPDGSVDVSAEMPDVAEFLRRELLTSWNELAASDHVGEQPTDPKLREILRARGYW